MKLFSGISVLNAHSFTFVPTSTCCCRCWVSVFRYSAEQFQMFVCVLCHSAPNSKLMCVFVSLKTITCKCPSKLQHWMPFYYHFTSIESDVMCLGIVLHLCTQTKKHIHTMAEHHSKFLFSSSSHPPTVSLYCHFFHLCFVICALIYVQKVYSLLLPAANNSQQRQPIVLHFPLVKQIDKMSWIFYMSLHCNRKLVLILMMLGMCAVGMATTFISHLVYKRPERALY